MKNPNNANDYDCFYDHIDQPFSIQIINVWMSVLLSVQKNLKTSGRKEEWCRESAVWISCGGRHCEESEEGARKMGE